MQHPFFILFQRRDALCIVFACVVAVVSTPCVHAEQQAAWTFLVPQFRQGAGFSPAGGFSSEPTTSYNFEQVLSEVEDLLESDPANVDLLGHHLALRLDARTATVLEIRLRRDANRLLELDSLNTTALTTLAFLDIREWLRVRNGVDYRDVLPAPRDPFNLDEVEQKGGRIVEVHTEARKLKHGAHQRLQRALDQDPRNPHAAALMAVVCVTDPAFGCLEGLVRILQLYQAMNPLTDLLAGYRANAEGEYAAAENHFMRAFALLPEDMVDAYRDPYPVLLPDALLSDETARNFWSSRDARLLTDANERWTEHVSRAVYADLMFSDWETPLSGMRSVRGQVWLRYGKPSRDVNLFRMMEVASQTVRAGSAFHILEYPHSRFVFEHPASASSTEYRHYSPSADFYSKDMALGAIRDYVIKAREQIRERPEAFSTEGPGLTRVEFPYQMSRLRSGTGGSGMDILVSMAVQVPHIPQRGNLSMGLRTGLFAIAPDGSLPVKVTKDWVSLSASALRQVEDLPLWTWTDMLLSVPPGSDVAVEFETSESGAVFGHHRAGTTEPPLVMDGFGMSDIVLARLVLERTDGGARQSHAIDRGGTTIYPASIALFATQDPIYLYFETYGGQMQDGRARYQVSAALVERNDDRAIRRIFSSLSGRNRDAGALVSFDLESEDPDHNHYFVLDATNHKAGDYWVVMEITDLHSGQTTQARRAIVLY